MKTNLTRCILCLAWLCLACLPLRAQNTEPPPDSLKRYRWEVATDLLWIAKPDSMFIPSIFVRCHTKGGAWRLRIGGGHRKDIVEYNTPIPPPSPFRDGKDALTLSIFSRVGYQWNRQFPDFSLYYGLDVFHNRIKIKGNEYYTVNSENFHNLSITKKYQTGVTGFVGLQKKFWKRLSVSTEVGLSGHYEYYDYLKTMYEYPVDDPNSGGYTYITTKKWHTTFLPLYVFNLSYHF